MANTPYGQFTRRGLLAMIAALPAAPAWAAAPVVTILGDSITAGLGLPAREALPARLQAELDRMGASARVRGAGVSGDTTAAGLARVDFSVRPDTAVCVVALGANDLLQGLDPDRTRRNLDAIIRRLKQRGVGVVLAGMRAPPNLGGSYARDFNAAFSVLARKYDLVFYPALLAGVQGKRALNQKDGIHPNAAGVRIIAQGLAPSVIEALKRKRG